MFTSTTRRLTDDVEFLPSHRDDGRRELGLAPEGPALRLTGYWAGSTVHGSAGGHRRAAAERRPLLPAPRRRITSTYDPAAHVDERPRRHGRVPEDRRPEGAVQLRRHLQDARASTSTTSATCAAPTRSSSPAGCSSGGTRRRRLYRSFRLNLNQWAGWNFGGDTRFTGANVNAHIVAHVQLVGRRRLQRRGRRHRRPLDPRRAVRAVEARRATSGTTSSRTAARPSTAAGWASTSATRPARPRGAQTRGSTWRPTSFLTLSRGVGFEQMNEDTQWVENVERRLDDPLRLRPHPADDRRPADARQLHDHADAHRADLRRAVRVGRRLQRLQGTDVRRARTPVRRAVRPVPPTPATPTSTTSPSARTNVLRWEYKPGSALYVVWQQGREDVAETGRFRFGQDVGGPLRDPRRATCSW